MFHQEFPQEVSVFVPETNIQDESVVAQVRGCYTQKNHLTGHYELGNGVRIADVLRDEYNDQILNIQILNKEMTGLKGLDPTNYHKMTEVANKLNNEAFGAGIYIVQLLIQLGVPNAAYTEIAVNYELAGVPYGLVKDHTTGETGVVWKAYQDLLPYWNASENCFYDDTHYALYADMAPWGYQETVIYQEPVVIAQPYGYYPDVVVVPGYRYTT
ncbi:MAG: hypothetical protein ACRCXZ_00365 [Patescibacteria group bacterium]